jgi:hypothetical protein
VFLFHNLLKKNKTKKKALDPREKFEHIKADGWTEKEISDAKKSLRESIKNTKKSFGMQ